MTEVKLVVVEADELRRLIDDAVRAASRQAPATEEWLDARTSPLGRRAFLRLAGEGAFPVSRAGKKYVARRSDVDAYLERQRLKPQPVPLPSIEAVSAGAHDPIAQALAHGRLCIVKKSP